MSTIITINGLVSQPKNEPQANMIKAQISRFQKTGAAVNCHAASYTGTLRVQIAGSEDQIPRDWKRSLAKIATMAESCHLTYQRTDDPHYKIVISKDRYLDMPEMTESCVGYEWHDPFH